jgi:hypothetical protein
MTDQGFNEINYKGEPILPGVDDSTGVAYYQHIYSTSFTGDYRRHLCMQWGHWCWKQAREYPLDAVRFLFGRLRNYV